MAICPTAVVANRRMERLYLWIILTSSKTVTVGVQIGLPLEEWSDPRSVSRVCSGGLTSSKVRGGDEIGLVESPSLVSG